MNGTYSSTTTTVEEEEPVVVVVVEFDTTDTNNNPPNHPTTTSTISSESSVVRTGNDRGMTTTLSFRKGDHHRSNTLFPHYFCYCCYCGSSRNHCRVTIVHCIGFVLCSFVTLISIMKITHQIDLTTAGLIITRKPQSQYSQSQPPPLPNDHIVVELTPQSQQLQQLRQPSQLQPSQPQLRSFPKWGTSLLDEETVGIPFGPLFHFLQTSSRYQYHPSKFGTYYRPTTDHSKESQTVLPLLPETLYMVQPGGGIRTASTADSTTGSSSSRNNTRSSQLLPESVVVVSPPILYGSQLHRIHHGHAVATWNDTTFNKLHKVNHTEHMMLLALQTLHQEVVELWDTAVASNRNGGGDNHNNRLRTVCSQSRWPSLCRNLYPSSSSLSDDTTTPPTGGFPFLAWYGDYTGCNYHNWKQAATGAMEPIPQHLLSTRETINVSIPLFTVAAQSQTCHHTIPFPNFYQTVGSMEHADQWDPIMNQYQEQYPWTTKINQIVWRGSLSGRIDNNVTKCPRWHMVQAIHHIETERRERELEQRRRRPQQNVRTATTPTTGEQAPVVTSPNDSSSYKELFDVKLTYVPANMKQYQPQVEVDIGNVPITHSRLDFNDFQKYRGIIDIDGHSWSGRFGTLLCFNSVILKVDPTYVEYFYVRQPKDVGTSSDDNINYRLQAWKHYIPVRDDFSNMEEMAEFVIDPKNDNIIQDIVRNANDWCRMNMITSAISTDMLYVWDRYIELLNTNNNIHNNSTWNELYWTNDVTAELLNDDHLDMVSLHLADYPNPN